MPPRLGLLALDDGPDLISTLPDDLLLLVLARLGCAAAAARTGVLSSRWRRLWPGLRRIVFDDVALPSLEAALGGFPPPPPTVSLLEIRVPKRRPKEPRPDTARFSSLLRAAARLDPEELVLILASCFISSSAHLVLPCFHRATSIVLHLRSTIHCVPCLTGVEFPALHTLSLSHCSANVEALLSCCPRLRTLWLAHLRYHNAVLTVNSVLLQELVVADGGPPIHHVNIDTPVLTRLTMSLNLYPRAAISVLAPMAEKVSWRCCQPLYFGVWSLQQLSLQMAEGQGQLSSLHMHVDVALYALFLGGEADNFEQDNFEQDKFEQEIEKHMIIAFSVLELHITTEGHVYGAYVVHLLGTDRIRCDTQRLKISLKRSKIAEECPPHCHCVSPNWKSETISLTSLQEVEINGFQGEDHEFDLLKLILRCAPMLKGIIMKLSQEASARSDCTKLYNIFRAYSTVECFVYLSSGLMHVPN